MLEVVHFSFTINKRAVNIPKFLIDVMTNESLMIPNRNLPYGMILTHFFNYCKVDLSRDSDVPPAISIDRSLLKRMHVATPVQPAPHVPSPSPQGDRFIILIRSILFFAEPNAYHLP